MYDDGIYEHPTLGTFSWKGEVESWVRTIAIEFNGHREELPIQLSGYDLPAPTPQQAALATRVVGGLLANKWPAVRQMAMSPPTEFADEWEFEARRAETAIIIIDAHKWTVEVFLDGVDGSPPDTFNDLPMSFDFVEEG